MSGAYISPWVRLERKEFERSRAEFESRPDFKELLEQASKRGYRRITLSEQLDAGTIDAFTWRGGVWVKKE